MSRVRSRLLALATPRATAAAIVAYLASLVALSHYDARIARHAIITKPDLQFGYRLPDILGTFEALGAGGRSIYGVHLIVDTVMPVAFAAAAVLVVARAFPGRLGLLSIAPLLFMTLDIMENAAFAVMLQQYPEISPALVAFTRPLTMVKLLTFAVALPTLVVAGLRFLWLEWRARRVGDAHTVATAAPSAPASPPPG